MYHSLNKLIDQASILRAKETINIEENELIIFQQFQTSFSFTLGIFSQKNKYGNGAETFLSLLVEDSYSHHLSPYSADTTGWVG